MRGPGPGAQLARQLLADRVFEGDAVAEGVRVPHQQHPPRAGRGLGPLGPAEPAAVGREGNSERDRAVVAPEAIAELRVWVPRENVLDDLEGLGWDHEARDPLRP